jgi:uncharacterized protein YgiM (DUF1202 family)
MSIEERIFNFALRFVLGCIVLAILTSCSPLAAVPTSSPTPSPSPTVTATQSEVTTPSPVETCTVTTGYDNGRLNFRSGPGTQYAVLRLLSEGDVLQIVMRGAWLRVSTRENLTGYINGNYCQE